jgi:hypothetical protein
MSDDFSKKAQAKLRIYGQLPGESLQSSRRLKGAERCEENIFKNYPDKKYICAGQLLNAPEVIYMHPRI